VRSVHAGGTRTAGPAAAPLDEKHQSGQTAGCSPSRRPRLLEPAPACPRRWRSRRTAISSSNPIEQTPTSRCVCISNANDGRARDPDGSPFTCESGRPHRRDRRAVRARPDQQRGVGRAAFSQSLAEHQRSLRRRPVPASGLRAEVPPLLPQRRRRRSVFGAADFRSGAIA
jgi:hypothetical protein